MYMFPPHGERKRNDIFTAWNQCVSTRNKHLYNIYMYFVDFFFPFIFLSCIRGLVCTERLSLQQKISYTFSCLGGNEIKSLLLVRSWKWESNFGRPQPCEKQRQHEGHGRPAICSGAQTCEAYLYIPSTHLHCKQTVRRTCVCLWWICQGRTFCEGRTTPNTKYTLMHLERPTKEQKKKKLYATKPLKRLDLIK